MNKKEFIGIMKKYQTMMNKIRGVDKALKRLSPDFGGFYLKDPISLIDSLLEHIVGSDIVQYYMYEIDWGKNGKDCIKIHDTLYSLTNMDELWDYIQETKTCELK